MTKLDNLMCTVLSAARDRADYLEELANECAGYDHNDASKDFKERAHAIRLACAELDRN